MRNWFPWLGLVLLATCAPGSLESARQTYVFRGATMGTYYSVKVMAQELPRDRLDGLQVLIEAELEDVNAKMSTWDEASEISRFNRHRETTPFAVSASTLEVMAEASALWELTGGALDITLGPLIDAWGFGAAESVPDLDTAKVTELLSMIGADQLEIDRASVTLRKLQPDLECNVSSIAKGYAVDRVTEALIGEGLSDVWVEVGGEVRAVGKNAEGRIWRLGIERPDQTSGGLQRIVPLDGGAMATSGDYRNYKERDGERFSHILDPRTGWPIRHRLASVSVIHPKCMTADGLATGLLTLGPEEGFELARRENLPVLFLIREGDDFIEKMTPAFETLIRTAADATNEGL